MGEAGDWLFWLFALVLFIAFIYVPQWIARRQQKRREAELAVGDRVLTIGGFMGTLTRFDPEANIARIRLAEGVEVDVLPDAIRGKRVEASETSPEAEEEA